MHLQIWYENISTIYYICFIIKSVLSFVGTAIGGFCMSRLTPKHLLQFLQYMQKTFRAVQCKHLVICISFLHPVIIRTNTGLRWVLVSYESWSHMSAGLIWVLGSYECWTHLNPGLIWVLGSYECRTHMSAGLTWVLVSYESWSEMSAGRIWVLGSYECWVHMSPGLIRVLVSYECWSHMSAGFIWVLVSYEWDQHTHMRPAHSYETSTHINPALIWVPLRGGGATDGRGACGPHLHPRYLNLFGSN
jgi:hypothetical protein